MPAGYINRISDKVLEKLGAVLYSEPETPKMPMAILDTLHFRVDTETIAK